MNDSCSEAQAKSVQFSSVAQSCVRLFVTPWTTAHQASLSITNSWSLLKLMSIESVIPSNHLILCRPLLLPPSIFPASGSFPMSQFFASGGQSTGIPASASVLPMNIQDWFPLGWTGWISLQSKGLSFLAWYLANKHYIFLHYNLVSVDWPCFVVASGPDPSLVCQCFH